MNAVCLIVAGALRATLPAQEFTLAWEHSVQKTRWEERYRVEGRSLRLLEARIQGSGAGMEPAPGARLRDGWWTWRPATPPLPALRLTVSPFTSDYELCRRDRCRTLRSLVAVRDGSAVVEVRPCEARSR